ncbi:DUF6730 family protein [Wenyingzhuangia sp. 2_MG-2023]|uniref:DUF6730 family protein n=1 Tax=Wenyingzhuangia sp. 2_MG-2023 TaxID=3062639 RepID=UPI0026E21D27|nr:DUF6730 family protein [Wenyingzhuangia sp. 2_MG-2023]MDO6737387.1 hypothetical protein [Wenyingzhuangia sp. 2_MG-2023]
MAKIETITEMIVDEINHMEALVKEFKQEKEDLKQIKIEPNLNNLGKLLEANIQYLNTQNKEHKEVIKGTLVELKKQNKKFLLYLILMSLSIVMLMIELFVFKI